MILRLACAKIAVVVILVAGFCSDSLLGVQKLRLYVDFMGTFSIKLRTNEKIAQINPKNIL